MREPETTGFYSFPFGNVHRDIHKHPLTDCLKTTNEKVKQCAIKPVSQLSLSIKGMSKSPLHEDFVTLQKGIQWQSFCELFC
jgi:uncharacterized protein YtpQ (UPF0354 family)